MERSENSRLPEKLLIFFCRYEFTIKKDFFFFSFQSNLNKTCVRLPLCTIPVDFFCKLIDGPTSSSDTDESESSSLMLMFCGAQLLQLLSVASMPTFVAFSISSVNKQKNIHYASHQCKMLMHQNVNALSLGPIFFFSYILITSLSFQMQNSIFEHEFYWRRFENKIKISFE